LLHPTVSLSSMMQHLQIPEPSIPPDTFKI
jgi:hypothetical protein